MIYSENDLSGFTMLPPLKASKPLPNATVYALPGPSGPGMLPPLKPSQPKPREMTRGPAEGRTDRFTVLNNFWDYTAGQLKARALIVVWMLLYRDTKPDGIARASYADLARRGGGIDKRTVGRSLDQLQQLGLVEVVSQGGLGKGCNAYRVHGLIRLLVIRYRA